MILNSLKTAIENSESYALLHPSFPQVLEFLSTAHSLPDGRYDLDGDNLYVTIGSYVTRSAGEASLEVHDRYIDIQLLLSDEETYGWAPRSECHRVSSEYNSTNDIMFFDDAPSSYIPLTKGNIVVFYPYDAHAPLIGNDTIRKAIAKVKI